MSEVKRQTAYKCSVKMILEGKYIQRPGWDPNYIELNGLQISRVNILAVVVSKEGNSCIIDDGTGQIQIMAFGEDQKLKNANVGDVILIIARPREYNQKRFLVPEIIRKIENKKWIEYRRAELELIPHTIKQEEPDNIFEKITEQIPEKVIQEIEEKIKQETGFEDNYASIILSTIRKLDKGDGANINDIIRVSKLDKAEKYIESLINEGEIFEIKKGKIKVLE
jgi:RPA family protein